jgi:hypothetical protein
MKDWKWQAVVGFTVIVAAIVTMFGLTDNQGTRDHLIGYLDTLVPFVVGAAAGGTIGGTAGFARGRGLW